MSLEIIYRYRNLRNYPLSPRSQPTPRFQSESLIEGRLQVSTLQPPASSRDPHLPSVHTGSLRNVILIHCRHFFSRQHPILPLNARTKRPVILAVEIASVIVSRNGRYLLKGMAFSIPLPASFFQFFFRDTSSFTRDLPCLQWVV